ncbi:UvrD-helicase domain-containing protein [Brucepastera parasyntrophica]|uniref:UvrD-helicase domain-containing protein n=1 Tax=Brucepastera parasyntrophica TaxID=2880008 RepID=UPI00210B5059|nr:UvrD-helicase domain-containing protein [Brucepastera parasyntrophica]ULQ61069.1 UvrD-helicase domain-containing protein [Brucepastera parasyntrophica]
MKTYQELILELDENQRQAACISANAVIAAGAGSGKTRVLAARYVHLIIEKKYRIDEIVALTFTQKAAVEMYSRIYTTLCNIDADEAREAVRNFHLARIATIDSFCNTIARQACRAYGIAPDFEIDNDRAQALAEQLALPYFLEHRSSPALQQLLKSYPLSELPGKLFADTMIQYAPLSSPIDFDRFIFLQKQEIKKQFDITAGKMAEIISGLRQITGGRGKFRDALTSVLSADFIMPDISDPGSIREAIAFGKKLKALSLPGRVSDPDLLAMKELTAEFKTEVFPLFLSVCNYVLNETVIEETASLLAGFQDLFNRKKREAGILTFTDVSRLAVDALKTDISLRNSLKKTIRAIMIDEFQDDNDLQRDLLFLLAEKAEDGHPSVPEADGLCPDKLFFVGDEKQSIYRFRGADVSVFRKLALDLGGSNTPVLESNYRTEKKLISIFNSLFPHIFLNQALYEESSFPLYEATFSSIKSFRHTEDITPGLELLLINKASAEAGENSRTPEETEAAVIADRIRYLVDSGFEIRGEDGSRACRWNDIAILFKSGSRQYLYERFLRENGIPYQTETLRGLFNDAPVNDIYALLRLAVQPSDINAYATLLRSPLVGTSDICFTLALIHAAGTPDNDASVIIPFPAEIEEQLPEDDKLLFRNGRELYRSIRGLADRIPAAELISRIWYSEGYRYTLLCDADSHRFAELYDYFFELARQADAENKTLSEFLDAIAKLMSGEEKIEGLDIPVERNGGVHLMTVHKSKGLEFPVVFLADAGNPGRRTSNREPVYFSPETGISVNTGGAEDAEDADTNYFYEITKEEEIRKTEAELRRLLYVAMTRAETLLFISGVTELPAENPAIPRGPLEIRELLSEKLDKKNQRQKEAFLICCFPP